MLDEHADCGATLNGYAASVVECDLEDFAAPGRAFRLVANPPYALTAAVLSFAARSSYLPGADPVLPRAVVQRVVDQGRRDLRRFHAPSRSANLTKCLRAAVTCRLRCAPDPPP